MTIHETLSNIKENKLDTQIIGVTTLVDGRTGYTNNKVTLIENKSVVGGLSETVTANIPSNITKLYICAAATGTVSAISGTLVFKNNGATIHEITDILITPSANSAAYYSTDNEAVRVADSVEFQYTTGNNTGSLTLSCFFLDINLTTGGGGGGTEAVWGDITGTLSDQTDLNNRFKILEDRYEYYQIYQIISKSNTTGTVTIPTNAEVILDGYEGAADCIITAVESNRPKDEAAIDTTGSFITSTLDSAGNYALSGTPVDDYFAIVFQIKIKAKYSENVTNIIERFTTTEADEVLFESCCGATTEMKNVDRFKDINASPNSIKGFNYTKTSTSLQFEAGEVLLRTTNADNGQLFNCMIDATEIVLTDEATTFIYADYNSGSPILAGTTNPLIINFTTQTPIGVATRVGSNIEFADGRNAYVNGWAKLARKTIGAYGFEHMENSGIYLPFNHLGQPGGRYIYISEGANYLVTNIITHRAFNTLTGDTFYEVYGDNSTNTYTRTAADKLALDNTYFIDPDTFLPVEMNPNFYNVHVILVSLDATNPRFCVWRPCGQFQSASEAYAWQFPDYRPELGQFRPAESVPYAPTYVAAKVICQKGNDNIFDYQVIKKTSFQSNKPLEHNSLANLNDGSKYLHLTQEEKDAIPLQSHGVVALPTFTNNLDGTITLEDDGVFNFFQQADNDSLLVRLSNITGGLISTMVDGVNYIYADYNSGEPFYAVTQAPMTFIDNGTVVPCYRIIKENNELHVMDYDKYGLGLSDKLFFKDVALNSFERQSGLTLSTAATRISTVSAGSAWFGVQLYSLAANVAGSAGNLYEYYPVAGVWNKTSVSSYDSQYYSNGTNRQTLGTSKWVAKYFFRGVELDNEVYYIHGNQHNSAAEALNEAIPTVPNTVSAHALYVGKIVIQQGATNGTAYTRDWGALQALSTGNNHSNLISLDYASSGHTGFQATISDGTANQIWGMNNTATAKEWKSLTTGTTGTDFNISNGLNSISLNIPTASAANRGLLSTTDWATFNNKPTTFLGLTDTPSTYTDAANYYIRVNAGGNGLEFVAGTSAAIDHNDTTNIQGGTTAQYYHLTSAQHTIATQAASSTLSGYLTSTDWNTFNGKLSPNTAITGATKTKITYDSKGLVTSGADATTSDIADSLDKRYVTDAQLVVIGNTSGTNSGNETTTTIGTLINGATEKTTPVDADMVGITDSAASNVLKKLSWSNIKSTIRTYLIGIANSWSAKQTFTSNVAIDTNAGFTVITDTISSGAVTVNWNSSNVHKISLTSNITSMTFTAPTNGCSKMILFLTQDGTGGRTVAFPAGIKWAGGTAPTVTSTANKTDIITIVYDGSSYFAAPSQNF